MELIKDKRCENSLDQTKLLTQIVSTFRIKTNGSLPRDNRPQDFNGHVLSPAYTLKGPTSPSEDVVGDLSGIFSFESTYNTAKGM
jgi:hypothetical protein